MDPWVILKPPADMCSYKIIHGFFHRRCREAWSFFKLLDQDAGWERCPHLDVPGRKLGSMVGINGLFHPKEYSIYKKVITNPLILTIDPNFLRHPSIPSMGGLYI